VKIKSKFAFSPSTPNISVVKICCLLIERIVMLVEAQKALAVEVALKQT